MFLGAAPLALEAEPARGDRGGGGPSGELFWGWERGDSGCGVGTSALLVLSSLPPFFAPVFSFLLAPPSKPRALFRIALPRAIARAERGSPPGARPHSTAALAQDTKNSALSVVEEEEEEGEEA